MEPAMRRCGGKTRLVFSRRLAVGFFAMALIGPARSATADALSRRTTLSLDGDWRIADSVGPDRVPSTFSHHGPVPGLAHSAMPAFPDVDQYVTKQLLSNWSFYGLYSRAEYDRLGDIRGISHQARNYFWYEKTFKAPRPVAVAILKISKAQFGAAVFLNGVRIGEHAPCFTAAFFDATRAIRWNADNELVIRIGAHPGVLPPSVSGGTDFEKNRWTPGIYDDVTLMTMNNPVIATVQAAPRLASTGNPNAGMLVQTQLHNYSDHPVTSELRQQVFERKSGRAASAVKTVQVTLPAGATAQVRSVVPIPNAHLWSPSDPFLYELDTRTSGDELATRFGMREFHFDTVTQRAYLNGRPFFMRGSNIAINRFYEDPQSGTLPWNDAWLHRLLVDIPRQLHWNAFRFTLGPPPDRWLELADENGLLIEDEYPIWTGSPLFTIWKSSYDIDELIGEFREWMRDDWNHPSVVLWDASNESDFPELSSKVIPAVRGLDLSGRAWEDSYNSPNGPDDPVEDHQYFLEYPADGFDAGGEGTVFHLKDLESLQGPGPQPFLKTGHAGILNEYGWLWLNRDGSPTLLTEKLYPKLLGARNTVENRRDLAAYILGGETEFWRAYRRYTAVLHFAYLTASEPHGFTSDNFVDLAHLTLEPHFARAMEQAFKPLGVYLNFWQSTLKSRQSYHYGISMVNDEDHATTGRLRLVFTDLAGREVSVATSSFSLAALGAQTYFLDLEAPAVAGLYELHAIADPDGTAHNPTVSSRNVAVKMAD